MEIAALLGILGFMFRFGYTVSGLLFLWWRKEYRWDRMMIHLRTKQGATVIMGRTRILLCFAALMWFVMPFKDETQVLFSAALGVLGIQYLVRIQHWHLPPVSPKVIVLGSALFLFIAWVAVMMPYPAIIGLTAADVLLFPFSALVVLCMSVPTRVYHKLRIVQAVRALSLHVPMIVIGITGSYGKTSVKEYLSAILSGSLKTLKTEASKNSPIGIAETVLRSLSPAHQAFIVEMGAYKRGEIGYMATMVKPEIGVLTAINPQHQDLFGSIETTMQAKYELIRGLVGRKIAIVNLDDEKTRTMGTWALRDGCELWGWTTQDTAKTYKGVAANHLFRASKIRTTIHGVEFDCISGKMTEHVFAPVVGVHQAGNILAAIAAAVAGGLTFKDACVKASGIQAAHKVMEIIPGIQGAVFVDDTFNNNPDAARAAITFLQGQKGKKILVFQPMIELGAYAERSHEAVGALAGSVCDAVLLTNDSYNEAFMRGVRSVSKDVPVLVANPAEAATYIRKNIGKGDTVLFKGKDTEHTLNILV